MNVKEAVSTAKEYVAEIYADEPANHVGVEEVVFDEQDNVWKVTIGFFRPWDENPGVGGLLSQAAQGNSALWSRRSFKIVQVDDDTGEVQSMTHRSQSSFN